MALGLPGFCCARLLDPIIPGLPRLSSSRAAIAAMALLPRATGVLLLGATRASADSLPRTPGAAVDTLLWRSWGFTPQSRKGCHSQPPWPPSPLVQGLSGLAIFVVLLDHNCCWARESWTREVQPVFALVYHSISSLSRS